MSDIDRRGNAITEGRAALEAKRRHAQIARRRAAILDAECDVDHLILQIESKRRDIENMQAEITKLEQEIKGATNG